MLMTDDPSRILLRLWGLAANFYKMLECSQKQYAVRCVNRNLQHGGCFQAPAQGLSQEGLLSPNLPEIQPFTHHLHPLAHCKAPQLTAKSSSKPSI